MRHKAFKIASDSKYDGYQRGLALSFLIKNLLEVVSLLNLHKITNLQMNFTDALLENSKEKKFIHHLETIFGVLIELTCNH